MHIETSLFVLTMRTTKFIDDPHNPPKQFIIRAMSELRARQLAHMTWGLIEAKRYKWKDSTEPYCSVWESIDYVDCAPYLSDTIPQSGIEEIISFEPF